MAILERRVQRGVKWPEYGAWGKHWAELGARAGGFPSKRYYELISGSDDFGTFVWEREWDSLGASEEAYARLFSDPEAQQLGSTARDIYAGERAEYYQVHHIV